MKKFFVFVFNDNLPSVVNSIAPTEAVYAPLSLTELSQIPISCQVQTTFDTKICSTFSREFASLSVAKSEEPTIAEPGAPSVADSTDPSVVRSAEPTAVSSNAPSVTESEQPHRRGSPCKFPSIFLKKFNYYLSIKQIDRDSTFSL